MSDENLEDQVRSLFEKISSELSDQATQRILGVVLLNGPVKTEIIRELVHAPLGDRLNQLCKLGYIAETKEGYVITGFTKYLINLVKKFENFKDMQIHMYA